MRNEETIKPPHVGGSALNDGLGDWRMKHDTPTRMGISAFTLSEGAIVAVTQIDTRHDKLLVHAGTMADWMHKNWIEKHCERVV